MSADDRDPLDVAREALARWYSGEIRGAAESIIERCRDEGIAYGDHGDVTHETVDGRACIIYTYQAWLVCAESSNDGAYEEEMGEPAPTIEARAFMALRADVEEYLSRHAEEFEIPETGDTDGSDGDGDGSDE